jgi:hypothetical protein
MITVILLHGILKNASMMNVVLLTIVQFNVIHLHGILFNCGTLALYSAECHYNEGCFSLCHCHECYFAECRGAILEARIGIAIERGGVNVIKLFWSSLTLILCYNKRLVGMMISVS